MPVRLVGLFVVFLCLLGASKAGAQFDPAVGECWEFSMGESSCPTEEFYCYDPCVDFGGGNYACNVPLDWDYAQVQRNPHTWPNMDLVIFGSGYKVETVYEHHCSTRAYCDCMHVGDGIYQCVTDANTIHNGDRFVLANLNTDMPCVIDMFE